MSSQETSPDNMGEDVSTPANQPIALPLFAVQLQNIFPVEIVARRFPTTTTLLQDEQFVSPDAQLTIEEPTIQTETQQAHVSMNVQVLSTKGPYPFEISLKLTGQFTYREDYDLDLVRQFLKQGSLSVMLPTARELLISLSSRLQVPPIVLPLIQLAPPPASEVKREDIDH